MKAWQLSEPRKFASIEIDEPSSPGPGEALIRTLRMGICGTDISCYLGKFPFFDFPRIPGHELGVEVLKTGDGVENIKAGDLCSVEPYLNCGDCYACHKGQVNCCQNLKVFGVMMDGGLCEQSLIRADKLHPSKKLNSEQLALVETLAIGCHASDRGNPQEDEHLLLIGAGPIGLATLEFNRLSNAKITVMDMSEERLDFCQKYYGINSVIQFKGDGSEKEKMLQATNGNLYDLVTDATGNQHSMSGALNYVAHTGRLVYVGITTETISFTHPTLHRPEISIFASRNALPKDFPRIIKLIEDGTINTDPWITHHIKFDEVDRCFPEVSHPSSGAIKAIIQVSE